MDHKEFEQNFHRITLGTKEKRSMGFTGARKVEMSKENYDELYNLAKGSFDMKNKNQHLYRELGTAQGHLRSAQNSNEELRDENEKLKKNNRHLTNENNVLHKALDLLKEQFSNQKQQFADMVGRAKGKAIDSLNLKKYPTSLKRDDEQKAMNQVFQEKQQQRQEQKKNNQRKGPDLGM